MYVIDLLMSVEGYLSTKSDGIENPRWFCAGPMSTKGNKG
jgi:hypothetical protein